MNHLHSRVHNIKICTNDDNNLYTVFSLSEAARLSRNINYVTSTSSLVNTGMGDHKTSWYLSNQPPRPTQPGYPLWVGAMSTINGQSHWQGRNGKFCITVGPITRTAGILTKVVEDAGCVNWTSQLASVWLCPILIGFKCRQLEADEFPCNRSSSMQSLPLFLRE